MAAAPGWGADCGGVTPGPVFPATSSCGHGDSQNFVVTGRAGKVTGGRGLSQLCLEMRMLSKRPCTLQALPILSFLTLNSLGSVVTLISEQTLGAVINE